jgi:tRNA dimethylallyltransferase
MDESSTQGKAADNATPWLIAVMGTTASGKTHLAEGIARELDAQLINSDAFQVYRGMDVGTAKPANKADYELLDLVKPSEQFGLGQWLELASNCLDRLWRQGRSCVFVGGTGLYVRALFEGYDSMSPAPDPELRADLNRLHAEKGLPALVELLGNVDPSAMSGMDLANPARVKRAIERARLGTKMPPAKVPAFNKAKFGLEVPADVLEGRIGERVEQMVQNGWSLEVMRLREEGYRPDDPGFRAIGYRTLWRHLEGEIDLAEAIATTIVDTRRYAKRQRTWLRAEPKLIPLASAPGDDPLPRALDRLRFPRGVNLDG